MLTRIKCQSRFGSLSPWSIVTRRTLAPLLGSMAQLHSRPLEPVAHHGG